MAVPLLPDDSRAQGYDEFNVGEVRELARSLDATDETDRALLEDLIAYEQAHKDRKTALTAFEDALASAESPPDPADEEPPATADDADPDDATDADAEAGAPSRPLADAERIRVRNPGRRAVTVEGVGFQPGEVRELESTVSIENALADGRLQFVSEAK